MRFMRVQTPDLEWYKNNVPCQVACPAKTDIPRYISLIAQHRYRESYEVNCGSNLFPDVLGRVCSPPCETVCRRKKIDGKPIAIRGSWWPTASGWGASKVWAGHSGHR